MERRLTTKQACEMLGGWHRNTLGNRVRAGLIKAYRDGSRTYYLESELTRYMLGIQSTPTMADKAKKGRAIDAGLPVAKGSEHITVEEWEENERWLERCRQSAHLMELDPDD